LVPLQTLNEKQLAGENACPTWTPTPVFNGADEGFNAFPNGR
jgi:hypothetical protein